MGPSKGEDQIVRILAEVNWKCKKPGGEEEVKNKTPGKAPLLSGCKSKVVDPTGAGNHDWGIVDVTWTCKKLCGETDVTNSATPPPPGSCPKGGGHDWG